MTDVSTTLWHRLSRGLSTAGTVLLVLTLAVALTACGDEGVVEPEPPLDPPEVTGTIDDQELVVNDDNDDVDDTETIDISGVFDGEELTFSASSDDPSTASVSLDGTTLTVDPDNGGSTTVTVTAENDAGSADTSFDVSVILPPAPDPPEDS
jgi:predicted small lipoprotein YifL